MCNNIDNDGNYTQSDLLKNLIMWNRSRPLGMSVWKFEKISYKRS